MLVAVLGTLKAGAAFVPLDPAFPGERLAYMIEDAEVSALLAQGRLAERLLRGTEGRLSRVAERLSRGAGRVIRLDEEADAIARESATSPAPGARPENLAYIIYTSGSTGRPKGTLLEHRGLVNLTEAQVRAFGVRPGSRVLQFASPSFDASVSEIFMALCAGATLCLERAEGMLGGGDLAHVLSERAITTVTLPPVVLRTLEGVELPALATVVSAGE